MPSITKSESRNGSALKQGTLAFSSAKRTNSNTTAKTKKPPLARWSSSAIEKERQRVITLSSSDGEGDNDSLDPSSEEECSSTPTIPAKRSRTKPLKRTTPNAKQGSISSFDTEPKEDALEQRPRLDVSGKSFRTHYGQVREKMGNLEPIHAGGQNKVHQILRVFDMSYEYGPCVGMTRLARWERAASFGLKPPEEVRDLLLTEEGFNTDEYSQCVFYGEV